MSAQVGAHAAPPLQGGETEARQSQMMQFGVAQGASAGLAPPLLVSQVAGAASA